MRGMGSMFSMYGGATDVIEKEYNDLKKEMKNLIEEYKKVQKMVVDTSDEKKRKKESERDIRKAIDKTKGKLGVAKEQMKNILKNVSETAIKAASALSIGKKTKHAKPLKSLDKASVISDKASVISNKASVISDKVSTVGLEKGGESDFFRD